MKDVSDYPEVKLPKYPDLFPGKGPMAGLHSALLHATTPRVMLLACDMPLVNPALISYMLKIRTWAPVIIPYCNERFEPLHAIYHGSLLPIIELLIARNRLKMKDILDMVPKFLIRKKTIKDITGSLNCLSNINTLVEFNRLSRQS